MRDRALSDFLDGSYAKDKSDLNAANQLLKSP